MTPDEAKKLLQGISSRSDGKVLTDASSGGMSVATTALIFEVIINQMEEQRLLLEKLVRIRGDLTDDKVSI